MTKDTLLKAAATAKALATPARLRIVALLARGEATVSDLAARLGVERALVSIHLRVLREDGWVAVRSVGRLSHYYLSGNSRDLRVTTLVRWAAVVGRPPASRRPKDGRRHDGDLRQARTCYDHLAGAAGVYLLEELIRRRWLVRRQRGGRVRFDLTPRGATALVQLRVNVFKAKQQRRLFAMTCPDWSDRHHHLAGALGAALLRRLVTIGLIQLGRGGRRASLRGPLGGWFQQTREREGSPARSAPRTYPP